MSDIIHAARKATKCPGMAITYRQSRLRGTSGMNPGSDIRFDLALGLGVIGSTADTLHVSIIEPFGRVARYLRLTSVRSLIA